MPPREERDAALLLDIAEVRVWVVHTYDNVDIDELWNTVVTDVPALRVQVSHILK